MRELRFIDAVREAQAEEMRRDETIFVLGEGIGPRGGNFNQTKGLWAEFGDKRLLDTPLSEMGFTGLAIGAAVTGLRPIVDIMFWDFAYEVMGKIVNEAGRIHYLSNGQAKVPLVVRGTIGVDHSGGAHHSSRPYSLYTHMPGLKVAIPSTPYDAKGLLKTAIRDDNPVLFFEHRGLYNTKGLVPDEEYAIPFGQANVCREGADVTIIATAKMVLLALEAAETLSSEGISAEVIDPRTLVPLDKETILGSIRKTSRAVIVDEGFGPCGIGAEIAALAADDAFYSLNAPIKRVHSLSVPEPFSPPLEQAMVPSVEGVVRVVREMMQQ